MLSKWLSRKLFVFLVATGLVLAGKISDATWLAVALAYMGANLLRHYLRVLKDD